MIGSHRHLLTDVKAASWCLAARLALYFSCGIVPPVANSATRSPPHSPKLERRGSSRHHSDHRRVRRQSVPLAKVPLKIRDQPRRCAPPSDAERHLPLALPTSCRATFLEELVVLLHEPDEDAGYHRHHDREVSTPISHLTVGAFRDWLLGHPDDAAARHDAVSRPDTRNGGGQANLHAQPDLIPGGVGGGCIWRSARSACRAGIATRLQPE